jgi:hypothetical protein
MGGSPPQEKVRRRARLTTHVNSKDRRKAAFLFDRMPASVRAIT